MTWGHQELVLVETCAKAHYLHVKDTLVKVFSTNWQFFLLMCYAQNSHTFWQDPVYDCELFLVMNARRRPLKKGLPLNGKCDSLSAVCNTLASTSAALNGLNSSSAMKSQIVFRSLTAATVHSSRLFILFVEFMLMFRHLGFNLLSR